MTITPTPGRMIWFQPSPILGLGLPHPEKPMAAIVAAINDDGTINICAFDRNGNPFPQQNIPIIDPANNETWPEGLYAAGLEEGGWACWMPYQLNAAAKQASEAPAPASTTVEAPAPTPTATSDAVGGGGAKDPV